MAYIVNNKHIKHVSVLTEPNSYQTDIQPEDMQSGKTAVSKGKIITGTGRAFEFAKYGSEFVYPIPGENGEARMGVLIPEPSKSNIIFVSSMSGGDIIAQDAYVIDLSNGVPVKIGNNHTAKDGLVGVYVIYSDGFLCIYTDDSTDSNTAFNYFEGKDNLI